MVGMRGITMRKVMKVNLFRRRISERIESDDDCVMRELGDHAVRSRFVVGEIRVKQSAFCLEDKK